MKISIKSFYYFHTVGVGVGLEPLNAVVFVAWLFFTRRKSLGAHEITSYQPQIQFVHGLLSTIARIHILMEKQPRSRIAFLKQTPSLIFLLDVSGLLLF